MDDKQSPVITTFKLSIDNMVAKNEASYGLARFREDRFHRIKDYTLEEVEQIIQSGSTEAQISLSRNYFAKGGFYQRILLHYATLLKYIGIIIPNPSFGKSLSEPYIAKKYYNATTFIDKADLPKLFTHIATKALRDGCYYGIIQDITPTSISILDLPIFYCRSRFKDKAGNDIIEFNVRYFETIRDSEYRKNALKTYPKEVVNWYKKYKDNKVKSKWCYIPSDIGICMSMLDDGRPMFLDTIRAVLELEDAKEINRERDLDEIKKILVQQIPHLADGRLLFQPPEAAEMHAGSVDMLKQDPNISVLTTYTDVDAVVSKTSTDNSLNSVDKALANIYAESGTSSQLFGTDSNLSLPSSLMNDLSLMMILGHKLGTFITSILNKQFGNSNITFSYKILPITEYNKKDYIDTSLKMANSGYSFLLPALAMDVSQRELSNLKDLENNVLKLKEKLQPLSTSYTETNNVGRPEKDVQDKSAKTIANEKSLDSGGSN